MVNTRKSSEHKVNSPFISGRTRSSQRNNPNLDEHNSRVRKRETPAPYSLRQPKETSSDVNSSSPHLSPPPKRTRRQTPPSSTDTSPSPKSKGQRGPWNMPRHCTRLSTGALQNGHRRMNLQGDTTSDGDHGHMNGHVELKRSRRVRKSQFEHLNQSLLFDQLVNSTAEAVLQEMDNISSIRQNREVERLRMWTDTELENMDMYSRVKRRKSMRRNTFGMQNHHKALGKSKDTEEEEGTEESHDEGEEDEDVEADDDDDDDDGDEAEEAEEENDRPYNLRQRKTVQRYEAPPIEPVNRKQSKGSLFDTHRSPARRSHIRIKKHAIHSSESTSSSDEERFERRKSKSMSRARNRCLPMNLRAEDLASGVLRDRVKVGASLADVDPMNLDTSVKFDCVGGLTHHIQSLKEMVVFPLIYPEVFEKFKIQPPRGCLFYGPPGTGKTLVARALANECSQGDRKVSFFMRKGADCLSKWVGESERQLRLLFDQAYLMRPSIIFFDEIDGLAPVRSSRQDQIHSSIVSTLLALMDGLDSRGEIVVIGATNRLDSIDPALRRPGRFDREFLFNLPDKKARKHILEIHTRDWNPKLAEPFIDELAEKCVGYCGADIKALCTEAALAALRRRYPQIYGSSQRYQLDVGSIVLGPQDFGHALRSIVPAGQRTLAPPGQALSCVLRPLLEPTLAQTLACLMRVFPHAELLHREHTHDTDNHLLAAEDSYSEDEECLGAPSIYETQSGSTKKAASSATHKPFLHFTTSAYQQPTSYRPRLLLTGPQGAGQSTHVAPALLHHLEKFTVHRLDLPTLYSVSAKTPEESCAQVFREARRCVPSVIYMPHISDWWEAISETVKSTFLTLLQDVPSFTPLLILSTAETVYQQLPDELKCIFSRSHGEVVCLTTPGEEARRRFFSDLILVQAAKAPPRRRKTVCALEVLPLSEDPGPRQLSPEEQRRLVDQEENTLRELRLFLRDVTKRLATDKRFLIFSKPVDIEEVSDYLEVIKQPMDLSTIMLKIDTHKYTVTKDFLADIDLICSNALEYNPDKDPGDKIIRHRACSLKDTAHAMIASELDPEFDHMCEEIKESRRKRGSQTTPQPPITPSAVATRNPTGEEVGLSSSQGDGVDKHCSNSFKRKLRRRPMWGRGIIRKKKIYKKEEAEEVDDPEEEEEEEEERADDSTATAQGDACFTQDESSCDIMELHVNKQPLQANGHALSTEEENSCEPTVAPDSQVQEEASQASMGEASSGKETTEVAAVPAPQEFVNGDKSMDSVDSEAHGKETEGGEREVTVDLGSVKEVALDEKPEEQKESSAPECNAKETVTAEEGTVCDGEHEKGVSSKGKKCGKGPSEQQQEVLTDRHEEPLQFLPPPDLVVDHQRLQHLLEQVVLKSERFSVDHLERLYSMLSQCIYHYRRDYDKTHLIEAMERQVQHFETFL
ncbi:ATPase family AAA domain-containing protein 2B-like isoform X2 [Myxocyprinus asiaticus]|uniref:ATPase family AAA domain-containing protein 2B-like isoform X2 n=1 Tax=Myxocyprinus asiaticus TaxID=70543 RepID=UPI002223B4E9|nr:ATPase family AAA domain-containing protein 2B-like isoform X2 [Myxocyprinus asiaticus]